MIMNPSTIASKLVHLYLLFLLQIWKYVNLELSLLF